MKKIDDKVVFVTGGSSGLGLETVKRLAAAGATVVLTSRTEAKGRRAVEAANEYLVKKGRLPTQAKVYNLVLDLDDLSDVMRIASRYESLKLDRDISVLINNAGVMAIPNRELTVDGNERTFQSNHLGHFVLTSVLFPHLSRNGARVVTVSSSASYFVGPSGLDVGNLNGEKSYGAWPSYSSSKLANVLFTRELQRRASDAGLDWLTAATLHPGVVDTDLKMACRIDSLTMVGIVVPNVLSFLCCDANDILFCVITLTNKIFIKGIHSLLRCFLST